MGSPEPTPASARRSPIAAVKPGGAATTLSLADGMTVVVARHLTAFARPGDEVEFSDSFSGESRTELHMVRAGRVRPRELYQAQIGYVTQPKTDSRQAGFWPRLRPNPGPGAAGVSAVDLPA